MNASPQTHSSPVDENGHLASGSTERTSFWTAVDLVAGREMKVKMMSKAFVVTTVIVLGLLMLGVLLAPRLGDLFDGDGKKVAVTAETPRWYKVSATPTSLRSWTPRKLQRTPYVTAKRTPR